MKTVMAPVEVDITSGVWATTYTIGICFSRISLINSFTSQPCSLWIPPSAGVEGWS